jgi:hypothetical protein
MVITCLNCICKYRDMKPFTARIMLRHDFKGAKVRNFSGKTRPVLGF